MLEGENWEAIQFKEEMNRKMKEPDPTILSLFLLLSSLFIARKTELGNFLLNLGWNWKILTKYAFLKDLSKKL